MTAAPGGRKARGAWYTPPEIAAEIAGRALGPALGGPWRPGSPLRVVDPACGEGAFLVAALDLLVASYRAEGRDDAREVIARRHLFGAEVEPAAAERARATGAQVAGGDALLGVAWERGTFDVVLGNPPFVEASLLAARDPAWRARVTQEYAAARGNWDLFCPFVELAVALARPGGMIGLVVPNKLASADYASAARAILASRTRVLWRRDLPHAFDAAVYPMAFVACREDQPKAATGAPWRAPAPALDGVPLGELAEVSGAATVAEAYAMRELVVEGDDGLRVVNSGTIDRHAFRWGERPLRYLGRRIARPVVRDVDRLPPRRLAQARSPKIVVAGLSRRLECALDARGEYLAAKSTCVIRAAEDLAFLVRVLNSAVVSAWFRAEYGGNALGGGYLRVGPRQLASIPIPRASARDRRRVASLEADGAIDEAVLALYEGRTPTA